jgi:MFS family permease
LAIGLNIFLYGLIGPFAAAVMDRFGLRRTMLAALACIAAGVALTPLMTRPWQLIVLWGVVVGAGSGATALVLGATVVARWFAARRGLVMGVLTASTATGQLIFLPSLASLVADYGWRSVSLTVGAVALGLIPVVALLMRDRPVDIGLVPYGAAEGYRPPVMARGNPAATALLALRDGLRSRDFWLLAGSFFICGASTNGLIGTHLIPACLDHGIPQVAGASLLAAMGIFDLVGTTLSGWLSDRWSNRGLLAWYYGLRGLSLIYLPFAFDLSFYGLSLFAVFYGLDWIATVPPTVRLAAKIFGNGDAYANCVVGIEGAQSPCSGRWQYPGKTRGRRHHTGSAETSDRRRRSPDLCAERQHRQARPRCGLRGRGFFSPVRYQRAVVRAERRRLHRPFRTAPYPGPRLARYGD